MKQFVSLKKNCDFGMVYQRGKSYGNRLLIMYVLEKDQDHEGRVGISVSKKVGNSVVRHRIKRLIKESFRRNLMNWKTNYDYVIVVRKDAKDKDYKQIESALMHLGKHHNVYGDKGEKI
ncbi:MAG: ribonuclease P protein component [Clostridiales bacterium]|nr:ribonuclease P protein component [Clostridiales bacterium]